MCDFISWKKDSNGNIYFLRDEDVFSPHGRITLRDTRDNDILGHSAIDAFYGSATEHLPQFENRKFWDKTKFPAEIAVHLESPETLFATWGRMLKQSLQPDDALYILRAAPRPWRLAFMDICIPCVAKDMACALSALCEIDGLSKAQKDILVERVAENAARAYEALLWTVNLTKTQKDILVKALTEDAKLAYEALVRIVNLTKTQKDILVKAVVKSTEYAYCALFHVNSLTRVQRDVLVKAVAKNREYSRYTLYDAKRLNKAQRALLERS